MKKPRLLVYITFTALLSCGNDNSFDRSLSQVQLITVYDQRFLTSLGPSTNITLKQSQESLQTLNVDIAFSGCAQLTNISLNKAIDSLTGDFFIHEIQIRNLDILNNSNFRPISELSSHNFTNDGLILEGEAVGYNMSECADDC